MIARLLSPSLLVILIGIGVARFLPSTPSADTILIHGTPVAAGTTVATMRPGEYGWVTGVEVGIDSTCTAWIRHGLGLTPTRTRTNRALLQRDRDGYAVTFGNESGYNWWSNDSTTTAHIFNERTVRIDHVVLTDQHIEPASPGS